MKVSKIRKLLFEKLGISTTHDNTEIAHRSDVIFLAVKPPLVRKVAAEIAPSLTKEKLIVSIALGITIRSIESVKTHNQFHSSFTFRKYYYFTSPAISTTVLFPNFAQLLPSKARVVRVMPNTPVVVRAGASAYTIGSACREGDSDIVYDILSTVGYAVEVPESLVDPVTGLSGSGPSYVCPILICFVGLSSKIYYNGVL